MSIYLTVPGNIPLVDISPTNATLYMHDSFDVKLRCSVPDDEQARFLYWEKDGKQIYSGGGCQFPRTLVLNGTLHAGVLILKVKSEI